MAINYEELLKEVKEKAGKETVNNLLKQIDCKLEFDFLGFLNSYDALRKIANNDYTIVDLGCYMGAQSYLFSDYERYVGVDQINYLTRFSGNNVTHYEMRIQDFIAKERMESTLNLDKTFAICSFVPDEGAVADAINFFKNILVIYPKKNTVLKINGTIVDKSEYEVLKEFD